MKINHLSEYGFIRDPFPLVPGAKVTNWAGRDEIRQLLLDVVESVLVTDAGLSEFVVLHGEYGAGKSHALRYFSTLINEDPNDHYRSRAVYIKTIRLEQKVTFERLFREIIETIGFELLSELGGKVKKSLEVAEEKLKESLDKDVLVRLIQDSKLSRSVLEENVPEEDRPMVQLLLRLADGEKNAKDFMLGGKKALPDIGYPNPIDSDYMATKVLGSLFRTMTLSIAEQEPPCRGSYLFVDEIESILDVKATEQQALFQYFRELVNELPYNFCLMWGITADAALLEAVIPQALLTRFSRSYLELGSLEVDEAKAFLVSQFAQFRPEGFKRDNPYHPFQEATIELALEQITDMTPRRIFRKLRIVLERAIRRYGLEPGGEITPDLAQEILANAGL